MQQPWTPGVTIESVDDLYSRRDAMDIEGYYEKGEVNPWEGRCTVVPKTARFYAMVPSNDDLRLTMARLLLRGVAMRRRVREVVCEKDEINYNQFAPPGQIVVLYV